MSCALPVLVSGATGLVGRRLCSAWAAAGVTLRALTRNPGSATARRLAQGVARVAWDGVAPAQADLAGTAGVVHLAGEPVFAGRLTSNRRQRIRASRVDSTAAFVHAIGALRAPERPRFLICASAVGYYGDRGDERLAEGAAPGAGFLAEVCRDWEAAAAAAEAYGVRVVQLRIGIVLSRSGGALPRLTLPFRIGLGGRLGSGRQWFPWIHIDDLVGLIRTIADDAGISGAVNATAPNPVRNAELTRSLGRVLHRPTLLPVPGFALRAALGELADELLGSRRVVPQRALASGFGFRYAELEAALATELG